MSDTDEKVTTIEEFIVLLRGAFDHLRRKDAARVAELEEENAKLKDDIESLSTVRRVHRGA